MTLWALLLTEAAWATPPKPEAIYMVMVDRFASGDAQNDADTDPSDPQAFHGGDLQGVAAHLDHIQDLGFTDIWLSPITKMRTEPIGKHGAFHGYWVEDGGLLEPRFGDLSALSGLTSQLSTRRMGLYLDVVTNHVAPGSPLTQANPDWFHGLGDIERWEDEDEAITHDVHGLPDLAQERPAVSTHLIDQGLHWVGLTKPKGFRMDAVRHLPPSFVRQYLAAMRARGGTDFRLLGEIFEGNPVRLGQSASAYNLSETFDFPLHYAIVDVICRDGDPQQLASVLSMDWTYPSRHTHLTFLDNHDLPRIRTACGGDEERVADAMRLLLALRGLPVVTYGTEAGLMGKTEAEARGDMNFQRKAPVARVIREGLALRQAHPDLSLAPTLPLRSMPQSVSLARPGNTHLYVIGVSEHGGIAQAPSVDKGDFEALLPSEGRVGLWRYTGPSQSQLLRRTEALSEQKPVEVKVEVPAVALSPGQTLWLAGQDPALGAWSTSAALGPLTPGKPHTVQIRLGSVVEHKLFIRHADGKEEWAPGQNQYAHIETTQGLPAVLKAQWSAP